MDSNCIVGKCKIYNLQFKFEKRNRITLKKQRQIKVGFAFIKPGLLLITQACTYHPYPHNVLC